MRQGISIEEARRLVLDAVRLLPTEICAAADALGRVLAEPVVSGRTLPPADCSAMDGYAVRAAELAGASAERPVVLPVAYEVAAGGAASAPLPAGHAARIFTGAALPPGADTVVRQEDTAPDAAATSPPRVRFLVAPRRGLDVRPAGEDVRTGDRVLEPGTRLGAAELGMLAALGRSHVTLRRRPRVAILSGGDELIEPDGDPAGGRIVASNAYSLAALCRAAGAEPVSLGIARDTPEALEEKLRAGLGADVLVSSAGVSVGDRDYVRPVLEKIGCALVFWGVKMKPGFPLVFGRFDAAGPAGAPGPLVFGLPGNPVSAMVCFELFVRPALRRMAGHARIFRPTLAVRAGEEMKKPAGRAHFVRVTLERDGTGPGAGYVARSTGNQSSGVLRSMALAHALLVFPADATRIAQGDLATALVLDDGFFEAEGPGF